MKLSELTSYLESAVPAALQESYDNSGLQVGDPAMEVTSALLTLDITEEVMDEASARGCNLVISHHPLIFGGLRKLTLSTQAERIVARAVRENIAVYSAHTNLDSVEGGVSWKMAEKLGLKNVKVLSPLKDMLLKLVTYVPASHLGSVRDAVFSAGAGVTGNYDRCGFAVDGTGSFRGGETSNPFTGMKGIENFEKEVRFETILFSHDSGKVVRALLEAHPYEEVAYDLYPLANTNIRAGMGVTGEIEPGLSGAEFISAVSRAFGSRGLRYSPLTGNTIRKVAVCGGSGSSLVNAAISAGADAFITGDVKYHAFGEARARILLVDAGHFETEKYSVEILYDLIIKKFPKFALLFSDTNTNPINYI